jgi:outer membrane lipoprotein
MKVGESVSGKGPVWWAWVLFFAVLSGCVHSFSPILSDTAEKHLTFEVVIQNPQAYVGSVVLWGGVIRTVMIGPEGTQLIVTQAPLDSKLYPLASATEGDFIVHTLRQLDLTIFSRDTKVTVVGEIDGVNEGEQGPMEYPRPLVRMIEIHAWTEKLWGIFPLTKGWEVDELGPWASPYNRPPERRIEDYPPLKE